jgi:hypothetical protein
MEASLPNNIMALTIHCHLVGSTACELVGMIF